MVPDEDSSIMMQDDVIVMRHSQRRSTLRMKLLQFHEDVRPPYFGTFSKRSNAVSGRRPLGKAQELDYDNDSEAEWEEEPMEGDDCGSADEEDEEEAGPNDAEADDEDPWLVPHGYLSDDERGADDDDHEAAGELPLPSAGTNLERRTRLCVGCHWGAEATGHAVLGKYTFEPLVGLPIDISEALAAAAPEPIAAAAEPDDDGANSGAAAKPLPQELLPGLFF